MGAILHQGEQRDRPGGHPLGLGVPAEAGSAVQTKSEAGPAEAGWADPNC